MIPQVESDIQKRSQTDACLMCRCDVLLVVIEGEKIAE
jgi:hypothetical protein